MFRLFFALILTLRQPDLLLPDSIPQKQRCRGTPLARMQTTFLDLRVFPPPPAGANILTGRYRACAGCTADARVALVMQRIIGNIELFEISPYVGQTPVQQWTEFLQTVAGIKFRFEPDPFLSAPDRGASR